MIPKFKRALAAAGGTERFLATAFLFLLVVHVFFFLVIPQNWSLIDHYSQVLLWGRGDFDAFSEWKRFLGNLISIGRFRPIDIATWVVRYRYFPVSPRSFHVMQFFLLGAGFSALWFFTYRTTRSLRHAFLALTLAAGGLTVKDFISYTSASDPLATVFLVTSIAAYGTGKKGWSVPVFFAAFLTKESYFVFFFVFVALEIFGNYPERGFRRILPLIWMGLGAALFVAYIRSLPLIYASGFGLKNLSFFGTLKAFAFPVLRNFFPVFFLVGITLWKRPMSVWTSDRRRLFIAGGAIVLVYTSFMLLWGPFDSWLYMHIPIPMGWAMLFAGLWDSSPERIENRWAEGLLLVGTAIFLVGLALNGDRNFDLMHSEFKIVAKIACEDATREPRTRFFSNCNEGSLQLHHYLVLDHVCPNPPEFEYLGGKGELPKNVGAPYETVTMKRCDDIDPSTIPADSQIDLQWWTVRKKLAPK